MATTVKNDFHGGFVCTNSGALDIGSNGAVGAVNTDVTVTMLDGTTNPLISTDFIMAVPPAVLEAGVVVQGCVYKDAATVTVRTTNASAGAIDPASRAAGLWNFLVFRR